MRARIGGTLVPISRGDIRKGLPVHQAVMLGIPCPKGKSVVRLSGLLSAMLIIVLILSFLIILFTLSLNLLEKLLNAHVALVEGMLLLADAYIHATKGPLPEWGLLDLLMYIVMCHGR